MLELFGALIIAIAPPTTADTTPPFSAHRVAHDSAGNRLYVFSGLRAGAEGAARYRTALWEFGGGAWRQVADGGPWGRDDAQLAFDARRGRLVMHGGRQVMADRSVRVLTDTWEWDGTSWLRRDSLGPVARVHGGMAYDATRGVTVLFGGFGTDDSLRNDTWEWDGTRWTRRADGPAGRWVNALTWDPSRGRVVLHAADRSRYDRARDVASADLFEWDGARWTRIGDAPALSPQQPLVAMRGALVWYNGWQRDTPAETWVRRGDAWSRVEGVQPPRRRGAAMTYDAHRHVVVLIGGEDDRGALHDRWEFDGAAWHER